MRGLRPARNKADAAILRRGRAPRRQRWRRPGPTLALGVRPHLPRSPWRWRRRRQRALLPGRLTAATARRRLLSMAPSTTTRRGGTGARQHGDWPGRRVT